MQAEGVWQSIEPGDPKVAVIVRTDKVALATIYQDIPEEMLLILVEKKTSKEAWEAIKTLCMCAEQVKTTNV